MLRTLLGAVILLALPAVLNAQAPAPRQSGPSHPAVSHGVATQFQGEAVNADEFDGQNNHGDVHESRGGKNHDEVEQSDGDINNQEGVDQSDGPDHEDGVGEAERPEQDEPNDDAGEHQGSQMSRMGSHRP
jgi:hypothetical protein